VEQDRIRAIEGWATTIFQADAVSISQPVKMAGGAIQENWALDATVTGGPLAGTHALVLRTDAPSGVSVSHPRAHEFALLKAAFDAGATVPEPLALDADGSVLGKPMYLMRRAAGTANPRILARDPALDPLRAALAESLGRELAKIHAIRPPRSDLDFLKGADSDPIDRRLTEFRDQLDALPDPHPILELGTRWLDVNRPETGYHVLSHGDFRCGNLMVDPASGQLTAVLDWEFSSWSDPLEDVGWICARCWRFGADARHVGGIGDRVDFQRGYEVAAGRALNWAAVPYWEMLATVRWAIIALHQGERHLSGEEFSMELALTGRKAAEMEYDVLMLMRAIEDTRDQGTQG